MTACNGIRKRIGSNGNSLAVNITAEAKALGLKVNDEVFVTIERCDGVRENRLKGLEVIKAVMDGHVLRSDALNVRMALDPMRICTQKTPGTDCIAISAVEPTDNLPKDVWASACPDILTFAYATDWMIEDISVNEVNRNTRAFHAISRDALKELDGDQDPARMSEMIHRLNDIGWDYDAKNDCGVYDRERLRCPRSAGVRTRPAFRVRSDPLGCEEKPHGVPVRGKCSGTQLRQPVVGGRHGYHIPVQVRLEGR